MAAALIATDLQKYGFDSIHYDPPLEYEEIEVGGNRQVASLAGLAGIEAQTIKGLNPELLQGSSPPGEKSFSCEIANR